MSDKTCASVVPAQQSQSADTPLCRNLSVQQGIVLAEMYRTIGVPRYVTDLIGATGLSRGTLYPAMETLEAYGYVERWLKESAVAATATRGKRERRYFVLTDLGVSALRAAVRRFGARLGDLEGLPPVEPPEDEASRLADELARELQVVQERAGKTGAEMAAIVGLQQPWWAKITTGRVRQPKVDVLRTLLAALSVDAEDVERVAGIATRLNGCYVRYVPKPKGCRLTSDQEGLDRRVEELGRLLRGAVNGSGLTAAEVSRRAGMGRSWLWKVMGGRIQRPSAVALGVVAVVLEMPEEEAARVGVLADELSRM